ncbi:hypothetical protein TNIN_358511 [Trichonephila inaurata madagascariensis]|uniref:Pre-C2HC domain-containing protein n=1 Tax=Trichonephila inaurata madagascariensis TaxID=2747483 RepID=A0A8X6XMJ5_9ARAC|nr:hypothetical protein TNIN_358511 [Trichonephila inaurata madagascariensis]
MPPTEIISDLAAQGFAIEECHNMQSRKTGQPMPLFMLSMERMEKYKTIFKAVTSINFVKVVVEEKVLTTPDCPKPINEKPKCCLCEGVHPANFLGCPKIPRHRIAEEKEKKLNAKKNIHIVPEPLKVNFWEKRAKTAAQHQQSTPTGQPKLANPPAASTSSSNQNNSPDFTPDIFDELNPAVQETFKLLEQFIVIATTIPTKYSRLWAFSKLFKDELQIYSRNRNFFNLTLVSWNANRIRTRVEEFR